MPILPDPGEVAALIVVLILFAAVAAIHLALGPGNTHQPTETPEEQDTHHDQQTRH